MVSSQAEWIGRARDELRRNRLTASLAFASQGVLFAVLLTHVPQFKSRYSLGDGGITLVILGVSIMAGAGSATAESLARRISSRLTLQSGLVTISLAALAIAAAPNVLIFFIAFAVYGFGLGAVDAGTNMQAVAIQTRYGRTILTSFHACWSAGGILGALYVAGTERLGWSLATSIALPAVAAALFATASGTGLLRADGGTRLLRADGGTGLLRADRGTGLLPTDRDTGAGPVEITIPWRPVLLLGAAMICFYVTDAGAGSWATTYAHDVLNASSSLAPVAYAAYQVTALLSRIAGDHVVRRIGVQTAVRIGAAIGTGGLVLAIAAPGPWAAIIGFAIAGIGLPIVAPLCFSACGALAPGHADQIVARVNIFNYAGSIIGGVAIGGIGTISSLRWGFVVPAVLALLLLVLAPAFTPEKITA
jgi:MFS family permease